MAQDFSEAAMKKILIGIVPITGLIATSVSAADMAVKAAPPPLPPAPVYSWTGWYVGGNVGYGWGDSSDPSISIFDSTGVVLTPYFAASGSNAFQDVRANGVVGGGQIGYNYQVNNYVFGVVADFQGSGMRGSSLGIATPAQFAPTQQSLSQEEDWFGTVRGRIGVAYQNWLFYGTGGLGYGRVESSLVYSTFDRPTAFILSGSQDSTKVGWAAGAGVEYGITQNWSLGVEYLHLDLGTATVTAPVTVPAGFPAMTISANQRFSDEILRGMINYRF
jgi:outer membrane immunogenic protein